LLQTSLGLIIFLSLLTLFLPKYLSIIRRDSFLSFARDWFCMNLSNYTTLLSNSNSLCKLRYFCSSCTYIFFHTIWISDHLNNPVPMELLNKYIKLRKDFKENSSTLKTSQLARRYFLRDLQEVYTQFPYFHFAF